MNNLQTEKNVLILTHNYEGGSKIFLDHYVEQNFKDCGVFVLKSDSNSNDPLTNPENFLWINYRSPLQSYIIKADLQILSQEVQRAHITEVFINHLINFNLMGMVNWLIASKLPFTYMIHDYQCVCMNYRLDCNLQFCASSVVKPVCRYYLKKLLIWDWRKFWGNFLSAAKKIIAPSNYAANIIKNIYPHLSITVRPHILTAPFSRTFKKAFANREKLRITFLGLMVEHKGEEYLLRLNEFIHREKLPLEFVVIGKYSNEVFTGINQGIIFEGVYNVEEVSQKLAQFETGIVAILSNVPETYCYTASEAILSGYPVMTFNIGAQFLRVAQNNCGWILPIGTPSRGFEELKHFLRTITSEAGRKDILLKAANTANFKNGDA